MPTGFSDRFSIELIKRESASPRGDTAKPPVALHLQGIAAPLHLRA